MPDDCAAALLPSQGSAMRAMIVVFALGNLSALAVRPGRFGRIGQLRYAAAFARTNMLSFLWIVPFTAMVRQKFGLLALSFALGVFAIGNAMGMAGPARAVDAFGDDRRAWFGGGPVLKALEVFTETRISKKARSSETRGNDFCYLADLNRRDPGPVFRGRDEAPQMPRAAGAPDPGWVIAALGLFAIRKRAGAAAFWPGGGRMRGPTRQWACRA